MSDDKKIDLGLVFPAKGDSRRPPDWWGRGLLYAVIAVFVSVFVWRAWSEVSFVVLDVVIAMFIALAVEPVVVRLIRHGWRRGVAAGLSLLFLMVIVVVLLSMFGSLFVQQMISMIRGLPALYDRLSEVVAEHSRFRLPEMDSLGNEILRNVQTSWVTDFAGQAVSTTMGLLNFLLNLLTVVMVAFYISAAGPKMRRSMCRWLDPLTQKRFLFTWAVVQNQISGFLFSRTILALINAVVMAVLLEVINVPYWLPLALFCGIVSQFIPTVGTYIGGALPIVFVWGARGVTYAAIVFAAIVIYQQIENLILSPKISERTMDLNPAIAFLSVLVFGAVFGALGAFLALPITASLQVILKVYTKSYELVESPLMEDPKPVRKSVVVKGADAINEHVIKPVSEHMPRAVRGSTSRLSVGDGMDEFAEQLYGLSAQELDESLTVAIPKAVVAGRSRRRLRGVDDGETGQDLNGDGGAHKGTTPHGASDGDIETAVSDATGGADAVIDADGTDDVDTSIGQDASVAGERSASVGRPGRLRSDAFANESADDSGRSRSVGHKGANPRKGWR